MHILTKGIVLAACFLPAKHPKFTHLDPSVPVYIGVASLRADEDDAVSRGVKDSLKARGLDLIHAAQRMALLKQFFEEATQRLKEMPARDRGNSEAYTNLLYPKRPVSQTVYLLYSTAAGISTLEECDSIGFSYQRIPLQSKNPLAERYMWPVAELGSRNTDSAVRFLLRKL